MHKIFWGVFTFGLAAILILFAFDSLRSDSKEKIKVAPKPQIIKKIKVDPVVEITQKYLNAIRKKDYKTVCKYETVNLSTCVKAYKKTKLSLKAYRVLGNSTYYPPSYYSIRVSIDGATGSIVWNKIKDKFKIEQIMQD